MRQFTIPLNFSYFILSLIFSTIIVSCSGANYKVLEGEDGEKIIVGKLNWEQWQNNANWQDYTSGTYEPDGRRAIEISDYINVEPLKILIFAGSWCHDSETELPKIYKLIIKSGIFPDKVELYGLDRNKWEPSGWADSLMIERVPTLVVLAEGYEVDRIVEHPKVSWEADLWKIIQKDMFDVMNDSQDDSNSTIIEEENQENENPDEGNK